MNKFKKIAIALSLLGSVSTEFYAMKNSKKRVREEDIVAHSGTGGDAEDVGKRSYACDVVGCGKEFTRQDNLAQHKKSVHKGVRYSCDTCGKEFMWQSHLSRHKKSVHEGVRYLCEKCGQSFADKNNLARHRKEKRCKKGKQKKKRPLIADVVRVEDPVVDVDYEITLLQEAGAAFGELDGFEGAVVEGEELGTVIKVESTVSAEEIMRCIEDGIGIEELQIKNNPHVTDKELVEIASYCLLLKKLDVRGCTGITVGGITQLVKRCVTLETLCISLSEKITRDDVDRLSKLRVGLMIEIIEQD